MTPDDEKALRVGRAVLDACDVSQKQIKSIANQIAREGYSVGATLLCAIADAIVEPEREIVAWAVPTPDQKFIIEQTECWASKRAKELGVKPIRLTGTYRPGQHDGEEG